MRNGNKRRVSWAWRTLRSPHSRAERLLKSFWSRQAHTFRRPFSRPDSQHAETQGYPAAEIDYTHLSDQLPIILSILRDEEDQCGYKNNGIRAKRPTIEARQQRDEALRGEPDRVWPASTLNRPMNNHRRLYKVLTESLNRVSHGERGPPRKRADVDMRRARNS